MLCLPASANTPPCQVTPPAPELTQKLSKDPLFTLTRQKEGYYAMEDRDLCKIGSLIETSA